MLSFLLLLSLLSLLFLRALAIAAEAPEDIVGRPGDGAKNADRFRLPRSCPAGLGGLVHTEKDYEGKALPLPFYRIRGSDSAFHCGP